MEEQQALTVVRRDVVNIEDYAMPSDRLVSQVNLIQNVMRSVMRDGEHYGRIPGTNKPSLLKPGAEKLGVTFRLVPSYREEVVDLGHGHREYRVKCSLVHAPTGQFAGEGLGSCSTLETKYKYRTGAGESTGIFVPKSYWDVRKDDPIAAAKILKEVANAGGFVGDKFSTQKDDNGQWVITTRADKVEHDNPADYYNTCLKVAKKRAHVDAILTATAASDIFTQDVEDMPEQPQQQHMPPQSKQRSQYKSNSEYKRNETVDQITKSQTAKLWELGRAMNVGDPDITAFLRWANPVSSSTAESLIQDFQSRWAEWIKHVDSVSDIPL